MIDKLTKIQLWIFAVITAITLTIMAIFYLRLPATFGIGTYGVSADFVAGGGLYKNANVTYRAEPQRRHRRDAVEQRNAHPVECHRHRQERVRGR
jgi:hypothetical protein